MKASTWSDAMRNGRDAATPRGTTTGGLATSARAGLDTSRSVGSGARTGDVRVDASAGPTLAYATLGGLMQKPIASHRRHEDDEYIDEIRIDLVPRFKTSEMSGDEWRVSGRVRFFRKGHEVWSRSFSKLSTAVNALSWFWMVADEGPPDEWKMLTKEQELALCQQPGCSDASVKRYRFKKIRDCKQSGRMYEPDPSFEYVTAFCARHAHRGDCGLEDTDDNYEILSGGNNQASPVESKDLSPAAVAVLDVENLLGKNDDRTSGRFEDTLEDPTERGGDGG